MYIYSITESLHCIEEINNLVNQPDFNLNKRWSTKGEIVPVPVLCLNRLFLTFLKGAEGMWREAGLGCWASMGWLSRLEPGVSLGHPQPGKPQLRGDWAAEATGEVKTAGRQ